jgi:hypothetical protein
MIGHHHNCIITDELKDYDVICTTRNPYSRLLSGFFYITLTQTELTVQNFRKFFAKEMNEPVMLYEAYFGYPKIPKYFLRMENLYEDYFLKSLPNEFEIIPLEIPQECPTGEFYKEGWDKTCYRKVELFHKACEENQGELFAFSDVDIQFFGNITYLINLHNFCN